MKHNLTRHLLCGVILILSACTSLFSPGEITKDEIDTFDTQLTNLADQSLFSGAVLIGERGEILLSKGYGLADRAQNTPNTASTRFLIGSITKQFTAMAVLILESQGKLKVDDPICNYIPDCPATWQPIKVTHLLSHTSGILDNISLFKSTAPASVSQGIDQLKTEPLVFDPGTDWFYNNSAYIMLGYIIEQVSGQSYAEFMQQAIFNPLDLSDTGLGLEAPGLATGYQDRFSTDPVLFTMDIALVSSAGAMYSTIEDLYRWEQALSTEKLVPKASLEKMLSPQIPIPADQVTGGQDWSYGFGWFLGKAYEKSVHSHEGAIQGFRSIITRFPDEQITIIILSNQGDKDVLTIENLIVKTVFGDE